MTDKIQNKEKKLRNTNLIYRKIPLSALIYLYQSNLCCTSFFNLQILKGLDQGIFGGDGVPPMAVGMTFTTFASAAGSFFIFCFSFD